MRDVINVVHHMETGSICVIDDAFWELRKRILGIEQLILRAVDFETDIETPHRYLLNSCKTLRVTPAFVRLSWALLVDSLHNPRVLLSQPVETQAVAAMLVASQILPRETTFLPKGSIPWWESFAPKGVCLEALEEVAMAILDTYAKDIDTQHEQENRGLRDPGRPKMSFAVAKGQ